ncbi:MAG: tetratricopeptide repeat protein [Chloroflexota bacterium]
MSGEAEGMGYNRRVFTGRTIYGWAAGLLSLAILLISTRGAELAGRLWANNGWLALNETLSPRAIAPAAPALLTAEQVMRRAVALAGDDRSAWRGLGLALAWQGRTDEAILALQTAGSVSDEYLFLGDHYWQRERPQRALEWYERAAEAQPERAMTWYSIGQAQAALDRPAEALAAYQKALALDPAAAEIYFAIGELLSGQGQYGEADEWYRQALERRPDNLGWWLARANAARAAGDLGLAIEWYQAVIARLPDSARAYYELAQAERLNGDQSAAIAAIERALALGQPVPYGYYLRAGEIYEWAGLHQPALQAYQSALALRPQSQRARQSVERLLENERSDSEGK